MFYSLCVYFITFVISLLCTYGYQKVYDIEPKSETNVKYAIYKFIFFMGIVVPPVLIATFRGDTVGTDYKSYSIIYDSIKRYSLKDYLVVRQRGTWGIEYGYQLLCRLAYKINDKFILVNAFCEIIIMLFMFKGSLDYHKKLNVNMVYILFFYYMMEFSYGFNAVRFSMSMAVFFYSYQYIIDKKLIRYLICCVVAFLFHETSIVLPIFYCVNIFSNKSMKVFVRAILVAGIVIVLVFFRDIVRFFSNISILSKYTSVGIYSLDTANNIGFGAWIYILLLLGPVIVFWSNMTKKKTEIVSLLVGCCAYIPFRFLGYYNQWISRLMYFPEICVSVAAAYLLVSVNRNENRKLIKWYYFIVCVGYYIFNYVVNKYSEVYPFTWIQM